LAKEDKFSLCGCYKTLGRICHLKGETEKAIDYFEKALEIASSRNWQGRLSWINYNLAELFFDQGKHDEAHAAIERSKSHATNDKYNLGRSTELQAQFWYRQCRFEEAKATVLHAADVYGTIGASRNVEKCKILLRKIEAKMK